MICSTKPLCHSIILTAIETEISLVSETMQREHMDSKTHQNKTISWMIYFRMFVLILKERWKGRQNVAEKLTKVSVLLLSTER